ncbi:ROK family protein [Sphingomonas sp. AR_OL41]|uniref:ROK family protein n=1 Tax=Sphingomonas sp. AR_OL41 TaxID=3042729 RepID=UPI00248089D4|nr:ROK family protein [Sphingomonas sp. AR_OL41]MDH7972823.1 ROK family protein [Sphingomonas sp. AR_OL41]
MNLHPIPRSSSDTAAARVIVGVELGGTKCIATLADEHGVVLDQHKTPTTTPHETLPILAGLVDQWCASNNVAAIGIASFGPLDLNPTSPNYGCVATTTKPGWSGAPVLRRLSGQRDIPTAFDTDVNGAAAAEMRWGGGLGLRDFAYVTVGTGVGVGLFVNGAPTRGIGHCEMGHIRIPRLVNDVAASICKFHDDCVEGLASGPAIRSALGGRSFDEVSANDPVWSGVAHAIACLCHALVATTGPQRIAIGGGVLERQPHLLGRIEPLLRASMNGYLAIPDDGPYIVAPSLGDQAGALGPIALACGLLANGYIDGLTSIDRVGAVL